MGIIRNTKANDLAASAAKARDNGQVVFAALLNLPRTQPDLSSEIGDWSAMIEAVQNEGWQLTQWTVGQDNKGRPQAFPVFHRQP
ncbi:hypothetical protein [Kribbella deserti]|uniref:Resolvase/invertase-type recombinase catalytic domain-containing protein n=1 Tax=Kribbella deserti TaxID=1926257 RepID=A0ABV6QGM4_9ACTN